MEQLDFVDITAALAAQWIDNESRRDWSLIPRRHTRSSVVLSKDDDVLTRPTAMHVACSVVGESVASTTSWWSLYIAATALARVRTAGRNRDKFT